MQVQPTEKKRRCHDKAAGLRQTSDGTQTRRNSEMTGKAKKLKVEDNGDGKLAFAGPTFLGSPEPRELPLPYMAAPSGSRLCLLARD